ncbi:hypothetical protein DTO166G4_5876 [Paecilomyces variotii]|nr:hypothetical protein DTO032I3_7568 [Paecilomyces variotii]KAJ9212515.1 hypothetical protein DTO166G4_5876 [Paecilomyces variotii]KAJ9237038.1 hypothetical protein DTO166G5_3723 [Paecilomyces variotii]KAJ9238801.1 hypothetical protein DTO169E5_4634 [Paecilomyces variotii]KAJ9253493.1 hypothetical protein DTO195F2_7049 [Paecilomyces variotii]
MNWFSHRPLATVFLELHLYYNLTNFEGAQDLLLPFTPPIWKRNTLVSLSLHHLLSTLHTKSFTPHHTLTQRRNLRTK